MKEKTVSIVRFEGEFAVLRLNGHETKWLITELPDGVKEGDRVVFRTFKEDEIVSMRDKSAKELLNELLNSDETS